ncbi:MAG TPA: M50 family metallopeptidase [Planctomycetota bacterium]|nr:M50 family metallopeptidase [Planctomycetota bacterium]
MARADRSTFLTLVAIFIAVCFFWNTPVVYPLKVLVVFLHEISHGVAAVLTGGSIGHIQVNANEGGECRASGIRFVTLSAGYLGSMLAGATLIVLASRTRLDRAICALLGGFLLLMTLLYVDRAENGFGWGFGLAAGTALIVAARALPERFADLALKTIGLTSCMYAILDIKSDVIDRRGIGSDADMLADLTHVPALIWGLLWIALALAVAFIALVLAAPGEGSAPAGEPARAPASEPKPAGAAPALENAAALLEDLARSLPPRGRP